MNRLLAAVISIFRTKGDTMIDHAPIQRTSVAAKKIQRAREKAAARHGRQFHSDVIAPRLTEPSDQLKKLQSVAKPETGNVEQIGKKVRGA